jgi:hypothetical protein
LGGTQHVSVHLRHPARTRTGTRPLAHGSRTRSLSDGLAVARTLTRRDPDAASLEPAPSSHACHPDMAISAGRSAVDTRVRSVVQRPDAGAGTVSPERAPRAKKRPVCPDKAGKKVSGAHRGPRTHCVRSWSPLRQPSRPRGPCGFASPDCSGFARSEEHYLIAANLRRTRLRPSIPNTRSTPKVAPNQHRFKTLRVRSSGDHHG